MSNFDSRTQPPPFVEPTGPFRLGAQTFTMPVVVWALYLAGWFTGGVTTLIGMVVAYAVKSEATDIAWTHYVFAIRTIWVGLAWALIGVCLFVVGLPLTLVLIGVVFLKAAAIIWGLMSFWFTARSAMGLYYAIREEPYPRPRSWVI